MPDPNPQFVNLMSVQHLRELKRIWPDNDDEKQILDQVVGWRQIACRRAANKFHCGVLGMVTEADWEGFDATCARIGLKTALAAFDAMIEDYLRPRSKTHPCPPPGDAVPCEEEEYDDWNDDCEEDHGDDWKKR